MSLVVDASVTLSWIFEDERHPIAVAAFALLGPQRGMAPVLWWYEIRNVLIHGERRGRYSAADTANLLRLANDLLIDLDDERNESRIVNLARRHDLTVYDATYLELAQRERLPLATLDDELIAAARSEGVPLIGEAR